MTRRTIVGLQWTYAQVIVSAVLQLGVAAVLARLLTPRTFGLVALANLALRFVNYAARGGLTQAVVQAPRIDRTDLRVSHTAASLLGVVFAGIVVLAAPLAATAFDEPELAPVLRWMALAIPLFNLGATADAVLRRELRFATIAIREIVSYLVGYAVVGMYLAINGAGVWALVAASLTQIGVNSLTTYAVARHPIRPSLEREALRRLLSFGGRVTLISFLEFFGSELDTLVVGRAGSASVLGLYNRALYLVRLPLYQFETALSKVLFPALSSVQDQVARLRAGYLSAVRVVSALLLPIAAGIAVAAAEIVPVVLGDQWLDAIPVVPWMAAAAGLSTVTHFSAITAEATAALTPKIAIATTKVLVLGGLLLLVAGGPLWRYGAALAGASLVTHVLYQLLAVRVVEAPLRTLVGAYAPSIAAAGIVAGAIAVVRLALYAGGAPVALVLLAEMVTGGICLLGVLRVGPVRAARRDVLLRLHFGGMLGGGAVARVVVLALGRLDDPPRDDGGPPAV